MATSHSSLTMSYRLHSFHMLCQLRIPGISLIYQCLTRTIFLACYLNTQCLQTSKTIQKTGSFLISDRLHRSCAASCNCNSHTFFSNYSHVRSIRPSFLFCCFWYHFRIHFRSSLNSIFVICMHSANLPFYLYQCSVFAVDELDCCIFRSTVYNLSLPFSPLDCCYERSNHHRHSICRTPGQRQPPPRGHTINSMYIQ